MYKYVGIFGEMRVGTNYLDQLCRMNFVDNPVSTLTAEKMVKHEIPDTLRWLTECNENVDIYDYENMIHPIVIIKNPYSWYQSMIKENVNKTPKELYDRYNTFYEYFLHFSHDYYRECMLVTYEKVLIDPRGVLEDIAMLIGGSLNKDILIPDKVPRSAVFTTDRKAFYLQDGNFGLDGDTIKMITDAVCWDVVHQYGYKEKVYGV